MHMMLQDMVEARARLDAINAEIKAAQAAIVYAREDALHAARGAIREIIKASGFTYEEVLDQQVAEDATNQRPTYTLKADPSKVYTRGRLPIWMREAMVAEGLDPHKEKDRMAFRREYMV